MSILLPTRRALNVGAWASNSLWKAAKSVPFLDLRFADTKSLTDAVSGQNLITFTRASSGTYVGSDGLIKTAAVGEARFDHNPTTGESLGLLVEESRTNLLLRSEEFDDASWTKTASSVTANVITAPDGTLTADLLVENSANSTHTADQNYTFTQGVTYSVSVYVKQGPGSRFLCLNVAGGAPGATFNLANQTFVTATGSQTNVSASINPLSNGWFRCVLAWTHAMAFTSSQVRVSLSNNSASGGPPTYTGDGTSGIYIWGAQLEVGSFPTSYIPTTSATVTRSADVASITGANFTRWYRQDEGTMFARSGVNRVFDATRVTLEFGDGTNNNRFFLGNNGLTSQAYFFAASSGVSQVVSTSPNAFSSGFANNAITYKTDDFALVSNGATPVLDTSGTVPTVSALYIGKLGSTSGISTMWCGTISRLTYWPSRLPNSILQDITR